MKVAGCSGRMEEEGDPVVKKCCISFQLCRQRRNSGQIELLLQSGARSDRRGYFSRAVPAERRGVLDYADHQVKQCSVNHKSYQKFIDYPSEAFKKKLQFDCRTKIHIHTHVYPNAKLMSGNELET